MCHCVLPSVYGPDVCKKRNKFFEKIPIDGEQSDATKNFQFPIQNQMGWECPKCGRIYSPTTSICFYCYNNKKEDEKQLLKG